MKKTVLFKFPLLAAILTGFILFGSALDAHAQATVKTVIPKNGLYDVPVGNFVSPQLAITILTQEVNALKEQLAGLHEGTQAFRLMHAKYTYFNAVLDGIIEGKTVPQSIADGLRAVDADRFQITEATLAGYKQQAIDMLLA